MQWLASKWLLGRYEVSDTGVVRSLYSRFGPRRSPRPVKLHCNKDGYMEFTARLNGKSVHTLVHRAVLYTFTGAPRAGQQANHIDGVRANNEHSNLEWVSAQENIRHSYALLGREPNKPWSGCSGVQHPLSKSVQQKRVDGALLATFGSIAEASRAGFSKVCIARVCNGAATQHKGFVWAFTNQTVSTL